MFSSATVTQARMLALGARAMAAPILSYEDLGLVQGEGWLFRGLDVHIGARDRLALIGRNGAGKTTLLKCLADLIETDEGRRTIVPGTKVVLLEQDPDMSGHRDPARLGARRRRRARHRMRPTAIADQLGIDLVAAGRDRQRRRAAAGGDRPGAGAGARRAAARRADQPSRPRRRSNGSRTGSTRFTGAFIVISHDRTFLTRLTKSCLWLDRGQLRRAEIGFGGFDAWTEAVYAEEARAAEKLDAKLKLELHWLQRGVTARRRRNQGRLAKLHEMRAQRAAMLGAAGTAKLALAKDDVQTKTVIDAEQCRKSYRRAHDHPRLHAAHPARRPDRRRRRQRRRQDDPAQAADRRDCSPTAARSRWPRRCPGSSSTSSAS